MFSNNTAKKAWNVRKFTLDSLFLCTCHYALLNFSKKLTRKTSLTYFLRQICLSESLHFPVTCRGFRLLGTQPNSPYAALTAIAARVAFFRLRMPSGIAEQSTWTHPLTCHRAPPVLRRDRCVSRASALTGGDAAGSWGDPRPPPALQAFRSLVTYGVG